LNSNQKTPDAAKIEVLAETSNVATNGERQGPFPLLIAVEQGVIKGVNAPRGGGTRIVVSGDSFLFQDQLIDTAANHVFASQALNWLLERPDFILGNLGAQPIKEYRLLITGAQTTAVQWIFLVGMPGLVLLIGGLVWLRRRS
jgi:hypothetical protein